MSTPHAKTLAVTRYTWHLSHSSKG